MSDAILALLNPALTTLLAGEDDWPRFIQVGKWLKGARRFRQLALFSERLIRKEPPDEAVEVWHFHGQALIELGLLTTAEKLLIDLEPTIAGIAAKYDKVAVDLLALRGRIAKQRFFDLSSDARRFGQKILGEAIAHYAKAMARAGEQHGLRYFPAINLVALLAIGEARKWDLAIGMTSREIADRVESDLKAVEAAERTTNPWWNATMAERCLVDGNLEVFSRSLSDLVKDEKTDQEKAAEKTKWIEALPFVETAPDVSDFRADAFVLASVTRQLNEVWNIKQHPDAKFRELALMLDQALMRRQGGSIEIDPATIKASDELQAVQGEAGFLRCRWIVAGLETAKSVAAVLAREQGAWERIGTAFLVAVAGEQGAYALTNAHVISNLDEVKDGFPKATRAEDVRLRFEALDATEHEVEKIVWRSRIESYDATLLLLKSAPAGFNPLVSMRRIPDPTKARVYVIGYPSGKELSMSMQDNELLDHQGLRQPPPRAQGPVLVHYRAPTEKGSSGSPVFDDDGWNVIALHHKAREQSGAGLTLSGRRRYNRANEGISMESISQAIKTDCKLELKFAD